MKQLETIKDLKDFLNDLNEDQLQQPVRFWGDEEGGEIGNIDVLQEDWIQATDDGLEPRSSYKGEPEYKDEPAVLPKGTVMLGIKY